MKIIKKPISEKEVLLSVSESAKSKDIRESIILKAECCVDHLCGCK